MLYFFEFMMSGVCKKDSSGEILKTADCMCNFSNKLNAHNFYDLKYN